MKHEVLREGSGIWVTYLSVMFSIALVLLTPGPVLAQTTSTEDQYATEDQYLDDQPGNPASSCPICISSSLGESAAVSAFRASSALDSDSTKAERAAATKYGLTELPDTGGTPPLWLGILLVTGGVLTRRIAR